jgi:RecJ-like exonuclease
MKITLKELRATIRDILKESWLERRPDEGDPENVRAYKARKEHGWDQSYPKRDTEVEDCPTCGGTGNDPSGFEWESDPCPTCGGKGWIQINCEKCGDPAMKDSNLCWACKEEEELGG